eukprot:scaffold10018_cov117-Isochrysis_galbana.AAC.3
MARTGCLTCTSILPIWAHAKRRRHIRRRCRRDGRVRRPQGGSALRFPSSSPSPTPKPQPLQKRRGASASPESGGEPPPRRVHLGRKGEMGSIPHPKEVCEHPNSHAERKLRDRWDAALRLFSNYPHTAGESRVNAARLALEDLARFEGSDPQLSLFRRRPDGTFAIAGARLGARLNKRR